MAGQVYRTLVVNSRSNRSRAATECQLNEIHQIQVNLKVLQPARQLQNARLIILLEPQGPATQTIELLLPMLQKTSSMRTSWAR